MRGQLGNIKYRQIHRDPPNNASGMLSHDAHRLTAQQSIKTVRIAPRHHRQTGFWLDPGVGAITHRAPMAHFAHLPHWQVQLQYRLHKIRRQRISQQWLRVETVQERPGTHQIKVPLGSEKDRPHSPPPPPPNGFLSRSWRRRHNPPCPHGSLRALAALAGPVAIPVAQDPSAAYQPAMAAGGNRTRTPRYAPNQSAIGVRERHPRNWPGST